VPTVAIRERMHGAEWGGRCGHPQSQDPQETCEDRIRNPRCGAGRCKWKRAHLRRRRCWCRKVMATEEKSRPGEESRRRRRVESRRGGGAATGVESREGKGRERRPVSGGQAGFPVKTRLPRGRNTCAESFQIDSSRDAWKIVAWVSSPGKMAGSPRGKLLPK
jgi:hypothetical protein